jgi:GT2 family glycosyltransferase
MQLSIIIVNYKTPGLVLDCLRTIYEHTRHTGFEVIVADNGSGDNSRESITGAFEKVRWIDMGYNAGFARANNAGIRQSAGDVILLLNSDTLMEGDAIGQCYDRLSSSAYIAAGVQLLNKDRTPQISGVYNMPGGINQLLLLPCLGKILKTLGQWFNVSKPHLPDSPSLTEVDWISGAFLMVKKAAIEKAGLIDEDFFLYAEEAEWCGRLQKTGKLCIFGDLSAIHLEGESVNRKSGSSTKTNHHVYDRKGLQVMLSGLLRTRKQFGVPWFFVIFFFYLVEIPLYFLAVLIAGLFVKKGSAYSFRHWAGYLGNMFVLSGLAGRILRNRPYFYKVL